MASFENIIEGLNILKKYLKKNGNSVEGQHDILYAAPGVTEEEVSPEDKARLDELGWHFDIEGTSWARFT